MVGYMKLSPFFKRAAFNPNYYPTYAALGASAFLLGIYVCEWKTVGKYIPVWSKRYENDSW
ncbi:hypothetical protein M3Y95_00603500 [Aphelenchoides besseyi]|nr:hypothetical protein M3Y95_00603500 [Aphelenchoides besseyi]